MFGPNMTAEKYAAMKKWQRAVYWVAISLAVAATLYIWFIY